MKSCRQFCIQRHFITRNLQQLHALTPNAIRTLSRLTILLNVSTCEPRCCKSLSGHYRGCFHSQHDPLLSSSSSSSPHYQAILAEWYQAIEYIASFIKPNRLQLFFICDVADTIAAREVVQPLLSGILSTLRECNIRLNKLVNPAMNRIAHRAGRYAMGHSALMTETPSSFPFFALPWELRRQVLQYTDLLTPFHEF